MRDVTHSSIPVFIINLPESIERKDFMKTQCEGIGISPVFIEAVNGKNLSKSEISLYCNQNKAKQLFGRELLLGEIGCALSHKKIYQKMIDDNMPYAVILEDDAVIKEGFDKVVKLTLDLDVNWELVLLGHHKNQLKNLKSPISIWDNHLVNSEYSLGRLADFGFGSYGYIVNIKCAKKLLAELNTIYKPIDHYIPDSNFLNVYALHPVVINVNLDFDTLIDSGRVRQKDYNRHVVILLEKLGIFDTAVSVKDFIKTLKPIKKYKRW